MGEMETNNVLGYFPIRMQGHVKAACFCPRPGLSMAGSGEAARGWVVATMGIEAPLLRIG